MVLKDSLRLGINMLKNGPGLGTGSRSRIGARRVSLWSYLAASAMERPLVPTTQSTLHRFGLRRFIRSEQGVVHRIAPGSPTTQLLQPCLCPMQGCGFRTRTAQAMSSHLRHQHKVMPLPESSSSSAADDPPGGVIARLPLPADEALADETDEAPADEASADQIDEEPPRRK